jgi:hypothetical protein
MVVAAVDMVGEKVSGKKEGINLVGWFSVNRM